MYKPGNSNLRGDILDVLRESARNEGLYIGQAAMPLWNVNRQKGVFAKLDVDNLIAKVGDAKVAPGSKFQRDQRTVTDDNYATLKYGGEEVLPIEDIAEISNYFDVEVDTAMALWAKGRLGLEEDIADELFDDTTNFASYKTDGSDWTTADSGTPIDDGREVVAKLKDQVKGFTGGARLVALANETTINAALATTQVRQALDYGGNGFADRNEVLRRLAVAWGVDEVRDSVIRGADGDYIWTANKVGFYVVGSGDTLRSTVQVGRVINWTSPQTLSDAEAVENMDGLLVESYDEVESDSRIIRVKRYQQVKLLNARAGHILYGLNA